MTQYYTFNKQHDYYNTTASDVAGSLEKYTIISHIAKSGIHETTTLRTPHGNEGTIHWKEYEIEINGVRHRMDDIRQIDLEGGRGYVVFSPAHRFQSLTLDLTRCRFPYRWILGDKRWRSGYTPDSKSWKVRSVLPFQYTANFGVGVGFTRQQARDNRCRVYTLSLQNYWQNEGRYPWSFRLRCGLCLHYPLTHILSP